MTKQNTKRIHIEIKGKSHEDESKKILSQRALDLGLKGYAQHNDGIVQVVAEGGRENVWALVKVCTSLKIKAKINEIVFYFREPENKFKNFSLI